MFGRISLATSLAAPLILGAIEPATTADHVPLEASVIAPPTSVTTSQTECSVENVPSIDRRQKELVGVWDASVSIDGERQVSQWRFHPDGKLELLPSESEDNVEVEGSGCWTLGEDSRVELEAKEVFFDSETGEVAGQLESSQSGSFRVPGRFATVSEAVFLDPVGNEISATTAVVRWTEED